MQSGIQVSKDAIPAIARLFGLNLPDDSQDAPQPPLQAVQSAPDSSGQSDPMPAIPDAQGGKEPTKMEALQRLMNPGALNLPPMQSAQNPVIPSRLSQSAPQPADAAPPMSVQSTPPVSPLPSGIASPPSGEGQVDPTFKEAHPKLAAFLKGALHFVQNAGPGIGAKTFGEGFQTATEQPFLREQKRLELAGMNLKNQYAPLQAMLGVRKTQGEIGKNEAEAGKATAEAGKATAETGAIPTKQALEAAQAEAANYKEDPNLGLIDLRTKQPVSSGGVAPLTTEEAQVLGKQPGDRVPLKVKNTANEIVQRGISVVPGANDAFLLNKGTGQKTPLGVGSPRAIFAPENRIIQTADPEKPGETKFMKAGQAVASGTAGPTSASVQVPKAVEKKATSGSWADQKIAFNTAIQHAELLRDAAKALNNKDMVAFNTVKNELARQFGDSDITNFDAIANAYNHEVTSVISKGHMTDKEVSTGHATMPGNANYATIDKVLNSYQGLMQSKMNQLQKQIDEGIKGNTGSSGASKSTASPDGMISVQIPGHPPGRIPASAKDKFLQDNPGATVQ